MHACLKLYMRVCIGVLRITNFKYERISNRITELQYFEIRVQSRSIKKHRQWHSNTVIINVCVITNVIFKISEINKEVN